MKNNQNEQFHEIDSINIAIPFMSTSVNSSYSWKQRRFKSHEYQEFENKIEKFFLLRRNEEKIRITWNEWLWVEYKFYFKIFNKNWSIKKKDLMNYEKTLTDSLSKYIEWFEDSKIKKAILEKIDSNEEKIEIKIYEIKE